MDENTQTEHSEHDIQPEVRLWMVCLVQAVQDLEGNLEDRADALAWIKDDENIVGSFGFVADVIGLDAKRLRDRILLRDRGNRQKARAVTRHPKRRSFVSPTPEMKSLWWMQPGAGRVPQTMTAIQNIGGML